MSFLDFSDSEEMFGLLLDFVTDAEAGCRDDPDRQRFLSDLRNALRALEEGGTDPGSPDLVEGLRELYAAIDREFMDDPVAGHIRDCMEELERLDGFER